MTNILDTPNDVTSHLASLKSAGYDTVIRYLAPFVGSWKVIQPPEARAIAVAGFKVVLVFEGTGRATGAFVGMRDGRAALVQAMAVGAPFGAVIYYAEDYDPDPSEFDGIVAAFREFRNTLNGKYRVGAYCSGALAKVLRDARVVDDTFDSTTGVKLPLIWITQSLGFHGSRAYLDSGEPFVMFQLLPGRVAALDEDPDVTWHNYLHENVDVGAFTPFSSQIQHPLTT
jgi:hypothetical protein